jgi:hypothetical protein
MSFAFLPKLHSARFPFADIIRSAVPTSKCQVTLSSQPPHPDHRLHSRPLSDISAGTAERIMPASGNRALCSFGRNANGITPPLLGTADQAWRQFPSKERPWQRRHRQANPAYSVDVGDPEAWRAARHCSGPARKWMIADGPWFERTQRHDARQSDNPFFTADSLIARPTSSRSAFFISFNSIVTLSILPVNLNGTL